MKILKAWVSEVIDPCWPLGCECSCFSDGPELFAKSGPTSRELGQTTQYICFVLALVVHLPILEWSLTLTIHLKSMD